MIGSLELITLQYLLGPDSTAQAVATRRLREGRAIRGVARRAGRRVDGKVGR
jgi:hypothetical protein